MRVLVITPYITSNSHPAFQRNQTGFGYMVHDIAQYVAKNADVDLFTSMVFTPEMKLDGFNVICRSKWTFIKNLRIRNLIDGLSFNRKYKQPIKSRLRALYIFAAIGQVESIMKEYDVVHIHGCSELTDAAIKACKRQNIPFLVTLHGLNSFETAINQNEPMKQHERDFLKQAAEYHYPVSFISTGNKKTSEAFIGAQQSNFHVICNGCKVERNPLTEDIREKYGIGSQEFVFAFVGNVSVNKNQIQVARAWSLLPEDIRQKCKVLFVGRYSEKDDLVRYIQSNNFEKSLLLCGMQPKEKVSDFLYACDATILTSITEGFGLSIIEGFVYGKPSLTFADLPAIPDLYDEQAMVLASDRSDKAFACAMELMMNKTFYQDYIRNYSLKYSFDNMVNEYYNLYKHVIDEKDCIFSA